MIRIAAKNVKSKKGCHDPWNRDIEKRGYFKPCHKIKQTLLK
jgi:hypothetical protein